MPTKISNKPVMTLNPGDGNLKPAASNWKDESIIQHILTEILNHSNDIIIINKNDNSQAAYDKNIVTNKMIIIRSFEIEPAIANGENYCGKLERVIINYTHQSNNNIDQKTTVIVKSLPDSEYCRQYVCATKMFERELKFYHEIVPMFERTINNFNIVPKTYLKNYPFLIMEDLSEQNFQLAPRHNQLNIDHAKLALKQLAKLHAVSYVVNRSQNILAKNFPESLYTDENDIVKNFMTNSFRTLTETVAEWPEGKYYAEKMLKIDIFQKVKNTVLNEDDASSDTEAFKVLNHGDLWINNILFKYDPKSGEPIDCRIIDFQHCRFTTPALDLLCFIHTSVNGCNSDLTINRLLRVYFDELALNLKQFNISNVYTFENLKRDMKNRIFFGFFSTCSTLSAVIAETRNQIDLTELSEENIQLSSAENPLSNIYAGNRFKAVFLEKLKYFDRNGALD